MKVIITGCAGFIGSNLTHKCLELGWQVVGIDNFSTGYRDMVDPKRFEGLPGTFELVETDINNPYIKNFPVVKDTDVIFHLAALPRVSFSTDHPVEANQANVNGTLNILELARALKVKRLVYSASSSMYGGQDIPFPTPEDTPAHPRSNYALQKHAGAEYCRLYGELYGLDTCCLVYFNVFGPHQRAGSAYATVISAFMEAASKEKECRVDGDGWQSRDFCYVDNVVNANILAANYSGKLSGDRFNIACGENYSVNQVFDAIQVLVGKDLKKSHTAPRLGDPRKSLADISKAKEVLGYEPTVKFMEGIALTVDWWLKGCPR